MAKLCVILRSASGRAEDLGQNAVLSNYDRKVICRVGENSVALETSPEKSSVPHSKIIVNELENLSA